MKIVDGSEYVIMPTEWLIGPFFRGFRVCWVSMVREGEKRKVHSREKHALERLFTGYVGFEDT